jgi:hypothetical protein
MRTRKRQGGSSGPKRADPAIAEALAAPEFGKLQKQAADFRDEIVRHLARTCGGGECDPVTAAVVAIAAEQRAASRFFAERAARTLAQADFLTSSRLGDACRQNLVAARELARKHGEVLRQRSDVFGFAWLDASGTEE